MPREIDILDDIESAMLSDQNITTRAMTNEEKAILGIKGIVSLGHTPVLVCQNGYRRPKWLIDLCNEFGVEIMRTKYMKNKSDMWLMDKTKASFYQDMGIKAYEYL